MASDDAGFWAKGADVAKVHRTVRIEIQKRENNDGSYFFWWRWRWQVYKDGKPLKRKNSKGKMVPVRGSEYGGKIETIPDQKRITEYKQQSPDGGGLG